MMNPAYLEGLGLPPDLTRTLRRTPMWRWNGLVVVLDAERGGRLLTRGELAAELAGNDLGELAREATTRRVPMGGLLVFCLHNSEGARFRVLGKKNS